MDFRDSDVPRGYFIYDKKVLELVPFRGAPRYVRISSEDVPSVEKIKGNVVKLIFTKDYGKNQNNRVIESIQALMPLQLHTDFTKIQLGLTGDKVSEDDIQIKSNTDILKDFISKASPPEHLKKGTILAIIDSLMNAEQ